jgi:hypothetical protein
MTIHSCSFLIYFVALSFVSMAVVMARPDGCPVCTVGTAAPQSSHLVNPTTGPISTGQFQITIGGVVVTESPNILRITSETDLPVVISSTTGTQFRGILLVLNKDGVDLLNRLVATSLAYKPQALCPTTNRSGFTHVNNELKSSATATIRMPSNLTAFLDINIVLSNRSPEGSVFYYSRFEITTATPAAPATAPVPVPITVPVPLSVAAPVPLPNPVAAPLPNPVPSPVTASVPTVPLPTAAPKRRHCGPFDIFGLRSFGPNCERCGILGLGILCPFDCNFFSRLLGLSDN